MCHLIFLAPLAGIPLFWVLSLDSAAPINAFLWIIFGFAGYKMIRAMMLPPKDGFKSLIGTEAQVVSPEGYGRYLVEAGHELWTARSDDELHAGEMAQVTATEGIKLVVKQAGPETGVKRNERHCH